MSKKNKDKDKDKDKREAMKKALSPTPQNDKKGADDTFSKLMQGMLAVPPLKKDKKDKA